MKDETEGKAISSVFENRLFKYVAILIHIVAMLTVSYSLVLDITYLNKSTFASEGLYYTFLILIIGRFLIPIVIAIFDILKHVHNKEANTLQV